MPRFSSLFGSFSFLLLTACSGGFGTMDGIMSSWYGAPLDEVIAQWGYPNQKQSFGGTDTTYLWFDSASYTMPTNTTGTVNVVGNMAYINTTTTGGGTLSGNCTRALTVDKKNIVIGTRWEGNDCPFAELLKYANWRRKQ